MVKYKPVARCGPPAVALVLCVAAGWPPAALAAYAQMAPLAQYLSADRASEVALARSAVPRSIGDHATVLVLEKAGYATAVKGSNGFVCFVGRSWANDFDNAEFWNPRIRTPQCWNAVAAGSLLEDYLNRTKWALAGDSRDDMAARTKAAFAAHQVAPAPGSVAYMLSKHQYINDAAPTWHPHVMFFVPATDGTAWGANAQDGPLYSTTSDTEPVTTYFLVVPRWSDGTPGPDASAPGKTGKHHHG